MIGTGIDKAVPLNTSNNYVPQMDKRFYFHFQIIEIYIHKTVKKSNLSLNLHYSIEFSLI